MLSGFCSCAFVASLDIMGDVFVDSGPEICPIDILYLLELELEAFYF